mgnify:CR=1 FL=1
MCCHLDAFLPGCGHVLADKVGLRLSDHAGKADVVGAAGADIRTATELVPPGPGVLVPINADGGRVYAIFGSRMGWERANFFAPDGAEPVIEYSWGKQNWLSWSADEQLNTRENVTVFDQTSFSKYLLTGPGAEQALQWLCTADMAVPVGKSVYTGMLNERGTYESDVTVTRTGAQEFLPGRKTESAVVQFRQDFASSSVHQTIEPLFRNNSTFGFEVRPTSGSVSATNPGECTPTGRVPTPNSAVARWSGR